MPDESCKYFKRLNKPFPQIKGDYCDLKKPKAVIDDSGFKSYECDASSCRKCELFILVETLGLK